MNLFNCARYAGWLVAALAVSACVESNPNANTAPATANTASVPAARADVCYFAGQPYSVGAKRDGQICEIGDVFSAGGGTVPGWQPAWQPARK